MTELELAELVERPNETLSAEYKSWLDLSNNVNRANLARHFAALSNHGGGYVVLGFEDDMTPSDSTRGNPDAYTRDAIAAISRKYLEPA
ncbi:MAG: helix-turn-helix domain-containing protein, partial [Caulobacterales bacterium]